MTEPDDPTPETPPKPDAPAQEPPAKPETDWRAEAKKWETRAKENKTAAERLAALEESQKSEQQKLMERAEAAERERDSMRTEALRLRIAAEKGLTPKQAARLRGSSEEELLADADELLSEFQPASARRYGDVDQGVRGNSPKGSDEDLDPAKLAAAALAQRGY
jgi:hypothetical protein